MNSVTEEELLAEEPLVPPWVKTAFVKIIAILLVILMLSFIYLNYPIIGQLVSKPVTDNTLYLKNVSVVFEDKPLAIIQEAYTSELETTMCLQGTHTGNKYTITNVYTPKIYSQSRTHVTHAGCEDTLILFHTHPYKSCIASGTDMNTLKKNQETDPNIIMIVMCEQNRFSLYT